MSTVWLRQQGGGPFLAVLCRVGYLSCPVPVSIAHTHPLTALFFPDSNIHVPSQVGTTQVEFRYLSHHTGDTRFSDVADRVMLHLRMLNPVDGLYPMFIDPVSG